MTKATATTSRMILAICSVACMHQQHTVLAFAPPIATRTTTTRFAALNEHMSPESRLDSLLEETKLATAIQLMEQNPDLEINKKRWASVFDAIERRTSEADIEEALSTAEGSDPTSFPIQSQARVEMTNMYRTLQKNHHLRIFGAAKQFPPASGSHSVTPILLEQITSLNMVALTPQPTNSLFIAGGFLAFSEILTAALTGIDFNLLIFATLSLALFDRITTNGAVFESFIKIFSPGVQNKIIRHEAAHFLTAYLLGLPVEGCVLSAWAALQDARFDKRAVSAGTSFFDPDLSKEINSSIVTRSSIDRYSVVVMAGIAGEAISFGRADGGAGDEMALVQFLSQLNGKPKPGVVPKWNNDSIRNQARWGALQAVLLLRKYQPSYEALVDALERGGNLGDCIYAIEKAARENGLETMKEPDGYILDQGLYGEWTTERPKDAPLPVMGKVEAPPKSSEETLADLRAYRQQMESRLQGIDDRLKQIDE